MGANVSAIDVKHLTPLHFAAWQGKIEGKMQKLSLTFDFFFFFKF